ncbi:hypothetical protein Taro_040927 [Colocasia esculenta]|uniref:Uncharacterized protein n=1 Tax=Colocasia esculenta TaxID=4460 RepID=A0A843WVX2_COLES|nr:hypothetical protein [Colocasia esculenta]
MRRGSSCWMTGHILLRASDRCSIEQLTTPLPPYSTQCFIPTLIDLSHFGALSTSGMSGVVYMWVLRLESMLDRGGYRQEWDLLEGAGD